jgi:hypothetical protein
MKGQTDGSRGTVVKVCSKLFQREVNIIWAGSLKWNWWTEGNDVTVALKEKSEVYTLSRAQLSFSTKPCDESKPEDFGESTEFLFQNDEATRRMIQKPTCMKTIDVWGRYK